MEREQTTIRLPVELKDQLQQEAERLDVNLHSIFELLDLFREKTDSRFKGRDIILHTINN